MKALKLIIVFVLILGGIVGAFLLIDGGGKRDVLPPISDTTYETYRQQFEDEWEQAGDWNETVFSRNCNTVQQLGRQFDFDVTPLKNLNTSLAVEAVYDNVLAEWSSAACRKNRVDGYIAAIKTIEKENSEAASNPLVKEVKNIYSVYQNAYVFAHRGIGLTPTFDGKSWNSYDTYREGVLRKRNEIQNNTTYRTYLANISDIKSALSGVDGKLDNGRKRFYDELATKIVGHYKSIEPNARTVEQLQVLRSARNTYEEQYGANGHLNEFASEFAADVARNDNM